MITAVLTKFKRENELDMIVAYLMALPEIDQILIRDNQEENLMSWGKFTVIPEAQNEIIYVQDDDCILLNIEELLSNYSEEIITNTLKKSHINAYSGLDSMLGWGAIFNRKHVDVFNKYLVKYGVDDVLKREADRIFTCLVPHKTIMGDIKDFPSASADFALYRQPEHEQFKQEALRRAKELI